MAQQNSSLSPLLQQALHSIDASTAGMTDEEMIWHPEGKWSSAQILEHLSLAFSSTVTRMKDTLAQDVTPEIRQPTFKERMGSFLVIKLNYIPPGRKAPERIVPKGISPAEAREAVRSSLAEVDGVINECAKRFGRQTIVMIHPSLGPLTVKQWRKFHCVHTLHHMRQIQKMRQKMNAMRH